MFKSTQLFNLRLEHKLSDLLNQISGSETKDDIFSALQKYDSDPLLDYNNRPYKITIFLIVLLSVVSTVAILKVFPHFPIKFFVYIYLLLLFVCFYIKSYIKKDNKKNELIQCIIYKWLTFDNDLQFSSYNNTSVFSNQNDFPEIFSRGNHQSCIDTVAFKEQSFKEIAIRYHFYHYHYVNKIVRKSTDNKGKTKTDINYEGFDSFGVFIEGIYDVYGIAASKKNKFYPKTWQTSDYRFNKKYKLTGFDEIELSKFFTPVRIVALDNLFSNFQARNLIFHDRKPLMVFEFDDNIFHENNHSLNSHLSSINELVKEIPNVKLDNYQKLKPVLDEFILRII